MAMPSRADLLKLDVATRLELIEALWDSIAEDPASATQLSLTDSERELIDQRLREHRQYPAAARPWPKCERRSSRTDDALSRCSAIREPRYRRSPCVPFAARPGR
jgi:putative addiction module component (TIGR02574 family)